MTVLYPKLCYHGLVGWLCWGLTSQSTIFQSYRDEAISSWVINQYFWGVKCLAQGHNTAAVGLEPRTSRSGVRHSTTEPPCSLLSWESVVKGLPCIPNITMKTHVKSKSVVKWLFIFWKMGSWAVAWALRARDSEAALENVVVTLETFSIPTPKVLTSFFTKFRVCGVIVASATVIEKNVIWNKS